MDLCHLSCITKVKFVLISSSGRLAEFEFELKKSEIGAWLYGDIEGLDWYSVEMMDFYRIFPAIYDSSYIASSLSEVC